MDSAIDLLLLMLPLGLMMFQMKTTRMMLMLIIRVQEGVVGELLHRRRSSSVEGEEVEEAVAVAVLVLLLSSVEVFAVHRIWERVVVREEEEGQK